MMQQDPWAGANISSTVADDWVRACKSAPCSPLKPPKPRGATSSTAAAAVESFHVAHKVPTGDTPYVKAKRVQLVDKDPEKAIALFWAAINAGDRVDSALKDMAIVMKQQNRPEEAIEAIKSLRFRCSDQAQESLDNILLDLYKRCGRLDDQIALLKYKLQLIQHGLAFNGKRTKTARSQGKKFQVSVEQEATRLLGNLGWALMQKDNYVEAEAAYRRALLIDADNNKMCNLGICLMKQGRIAEAKETLKKVRPAAVDTVRGADSHLKAYDRSQEMLRDLENKLVGRLPGLDFLDAFIGSSSSIWQPQPCIDYPMQQAAVAPPPPPSQRPQQHQRQSRDGFANENVNSINIRVAGGTGSGKTTAKPELTSLNFDAPPFFLAKLMKDCEGGVINDPLGNLKRTRSGNQLEKTGPQVLPAKDEELRRSKSEDVAAAAASAEDRWPELPDNNAFNEAIVAAVLTPVLEENESQSPALKKVGKRLRVFQDITQAMNSPK